MVGKGCETNSSRIFQQCYLRCCKLQNVTPLHNVLPSGNGKILDFCVDRIKYADWPPILNALSCDLSLHSICIKCRQQVKTVLEHIDCERLAKTVNKRCVMLTNFMLSNLVEAISQLLSKTTLLTSLILEGLQLRIPYLNPLCEALLSNSCLQHLHLPRCLIGDAGCLAICKCISGLPNILTLELSGCDLTSLGADYIADLVKYQKIHRYSENWIHTLRYRLPELDTMGGLRRITLCGNPHLGDVGVTKLLDVLADDLWIKALDVQNCGISEVTAATALRVMTSNTKLVVLDMRNNPEVSSESLSKVRAALRDNDRGTAGPFSWLASVSSNGSSCEKLVKPLPIKNGINKERASNPRNLNTTVRNTKINVSKKEKEYTEVLEEQLQEEISHRQQLEELNLQLVEQMKQLKQQQIRLWTNCAESSGSEPSLQASFASGELSNSSGSTASVPIDQTTLSYIQQAFKDIYTFIKNNQCHGQCLHETSLEEDKEKVSPHHGSPHEQMTETVVEYTDVTTEVPRNISPKKAHSTHQKMVDIGRVNKTSQSAHRLGDAQLKAMDTKPEMFERHMGDTKKAYNEDLRGLEDIISKSHKGSKKSSPRSSVSSDTLVCSPPRISPQEALYSSSESDDST